MSSTPVDLLLLYAYERCALRTRGTRLTPRVTALAEPLLITRRRRERRGRTPLVGYEGSGGHVRTELQPGSSRPCARDSLATQRGDYASTASVVKPASRPCASRPTTYTVMFTSP